MNSINVLKWAATIALGFGAAFLLLFAVGESAGGDWSGLGHLLPAVLMGLLIWLGWKKPQWGGLASMALGLFFVLRFYRSLAGGNLFGPLAIYIAPLLVGGLLLLIAAGLQSRTARGAGA